MLKSSASCNNLSPYISADTGDGEEKVISQGKCISYSYLVLLLEAFYASNCTKGDTKDCLSIVCRPCIEKNLVIHLALREKGKKEHQRHK